MTTHLQEPLHTTLLALARAMCNRVVQGTFGQGGGAYRWQALVDAAGEEEALTFLREAVEAQKPHLTLRPASSALVPFPGAKPIFLVVLCSRGRAEGLVQRLHAGDVLYYVTAPDGPVQAMTMRRLNMS